MSENSRIRTDHTEASQNISYYIPDYIRSVHKMFPDIFFIVQLKFIV